jgi:hypothetical protein
LNTGFTFGPAACAYGYDRTNFEARPQVETLAAFFMAASGRSKPNRIKKQL